MPGATACETGSRAVRLDGSSRQVVRSSTTAVGLPDPFSVGIWFRTTTAGGKPIGSGVTSAGSSSNGYWRIGFDSLFRWPDAPGNQWFTGDLDEAAVYPTALSAARVAVHYAEGRR